MEGDVLTTQKVATAVVAQWVTLDLTVKRKLIIAVPVPVRMEPSVLILGIPTYANVKLASLEDTVMIMWMTVLPFLVSMVGPAKMELMTILAPVPLATVERTVALPSANVNTALVIMGQLAMRETTAMCVSVLEDTGA